MSWSIFTGSYRTHLLKAVLLYFWGMLRGLGAWRAGKMLNAARQKERLTMCAELTVVWSLGACFNIHPLCASGQLCVGLLLFIPFSSSTGLEDSTSARGKLLGKGGKVFWDRWTSSIHLKVINRKTSRLSLLMSEFKGTFKCLFKEKPTFLFYYQKGFQGQSRPWVISFWHGSSWK